ncbi:bestrophin family ion channel [Bythopirellula polymerisocia]|uniref:Bestrophin, RFP-TM, chloride channel n=1 Tax=Bythopirellula polymerisocia TaxID=2528003 RepID=A0A5C6CYU5_9BACT|nr:bestrophin family ion channel [Bythopirellula polymerisocia]TWU28166.1 Bestrophin, RFP-TM, chloride channel [Bythopirellula polymerisocia]
MIGDNHFLPAFNVRHHVIRWLAIAAVYELGVAVLSRFVDFPVWQEGDEAATLLTFALGILLVYRTNAANDRWWEGRKLWGQLVNDCRNLALKARAHADVDAGELQKLGRLLAAYPHALRQHLRDEAYIEPLPGFDNETLPGSHLPGYLAGQIHELLNRWNRAGSLKETVWILDKHARALLEICGGCERIKSTPLASSYRSLLRWSTVAFIVISPWTVTFDRGITALPILLLAIAFLLAMEVTAEVIEEPFGKEADDLPLDQICNSISGFVEETLIP